MTHNYGPVARGEEGIELDPKTGQVLPESLSNIEDAPYYCPGCGMRAEYQRACTGRPEVPHAPIEVVSTDELKGDAENHTAAPSTDPARQ